jgi:hypothetical protein
MHAWLATELRWKIRIKLNRRPADISRHVGLKTLAGLDLRAPTVSVFDPDGNLPLRLSRTELSVRLLPFNDELVRDVCRDLCAYLLVEPWRGKFVDGTLPVDPIDCSYRGLGRRGGTPYICTEDGFTLDIPSIASHLKLSRVVVAGLITEGTPLPRFEGIGTAILSFLGPAGPKEIAKWARDTLASSRRTVTSSWGAVNGIRVYVHRNVWYELRHAVPDKYLGLH